MVRIVVHAALEQRPYSRSMEARPLPQQAVSETRRAPVLDTAVQADRPADATAAAILKAKVREWFRFDAANPRQLDLGFCLAHGPAPRGLTR